MAVTSLNAGELFSVRMYKRITTNPALVWANAYELRYDGPLLTSGGEASLRIAADDILEFEQAFHLPSTAFDRAVVSTLVEDGQPYDPESFISVPYGTSYGQRSTDGSGPEPLTTCLLVRREVGYGRAGRALYRGVLQDSETTSSSGQLSITPAAQAAMATAVNDAFSTLQTSLARNGFALVMAGKLLLGGGRSVRDVSAMAVAGATSKQLNNRYFDRA